jgi:hypothetical protein
MENEIKIKLGENGELITTDEAGMVETLLPEVQKPLFGCMPDERHPYIVFIVGVPVFAASSKIPDRVKAMIVSGLPPQLFRVLDTRDGKVYCIGRIV